MTKDRYNQIREDPEFLFKYYNEHEGVLRYPQQFKQHFYQWISLTTGMPYQVGEEMIKQKLDNKHGK